MTVQALAAAVSISDPPTYVSFTDEEEARRYREQHGQQEGLDDDGYDQLDRDAFGGVFG